MSLIALKAELRQELKLTPRLLQSMEVLQMNSQELLEYLGRAAEENPVLEREDRPLEDYEELRARSSWLDGGVPAFARAGGELPDWGAPDREAESLNAFLRDQLERLRLPRPLLAVAEYLAELVDGDGFLDPEDLEGLRELKLPEGLPERALELLQSLDPPGVGARSLSECLTLQLRRQGDASPAALAIAGRFLPELGRRHYGPICKALGLTVEEVREAERAISALEPRPGRAFQAPEAPACVRPDVFITEEDGTLQVVLNEYYLPRITVSGYYSRLLRETDEAETRNYLRRKLNQARWLLDSLERRGDTLRRCAGAVLEAQRPFFAGETGELAPMSLTALAERLECHPSTVSRAVRGKYLQCRRGTYPLRYFFSRAVGDVSRQAAKRRLAELIREEDPRRPLSDQRLSALLTAEGAPVARRTVAKYRLELGLPSSAARRRER